MTKLSSRLAIFGFVACILLFTLLLSSRDRYSTSPFHSGGAISTDDDGAITAPKLSTPAVTYREDVELVVASTQREDTRWLARHLPDWRAHVYVADDAGATLTVPANKGHEAMAYLTHLIAAYDSLPPVLVFAHASRFAWHNDDPDYDALPALRRLRIARVRAAGYANLRCAWAVGCPAEIRPVADEMAEQDRNTKDRGQGNPTTTTTKGIFHQAWKELMPGVPVPEVVAVGCCSQFAVSREAIRRRPLKDYIRFRNWLLETPLDDSLSGRVFEFMWHIIFGMEAEHCPSAQECYCETFGICDTICPNVGECEGRYTLPPYSSLPSGWPLVDWAGEERNFTGPLD